VRLRADIELDGVEYRGKRSNRSAMFGEQEQDDEEDEDDVDEDEDEDMEEEGEEGEEEGEDDKETEDDDRTVMIPKRLPSMSGDLISDLCGHDGFINSVLGYTCSHIFPPVHLEQVVGLLS